MEWSTAAPVLRARELLNLARLAMRCADLADADDEARRAWQAEAEGAWVSVQPLLPSLRDLGPSADDVLAVAEQLSAQLSAPAGPRAPAHPRRAGGGDAPESPTPMRPA
jgi:hypothetical protein